MYQRMLVAYDDSENAEVALRQAVRLARVSDAALWVLWVREALPQFAETIDEVDEEEEAASTYFRRIQKRVKAHEADLGKPIHVECRPGQPGKNIVAYAEELGCDLIVLGHTGHSGLWGRLLGHTADRVSEHAHCDVLIIRGKEKS